MELFSFLEPRGGQPDGGGGSYLPHQHSGDQLHQHHRQHHHRHQQAASFLHPLQYSQQQQRQEQQAGGGDGITFNFNRRRLAGRGGDVEVRVWLTFEESVRGCVRELRFRALVPCATCRGRGLQSLLDAGLVRSRDELTPCAHCHGTGTYSRRSALLTINSTCCHCNGHGYHLDQPCTQCSHGRIPDEKVLHIEVPQGVMHDMRMIYAGEGDAGEFGGESGDLVVMFGVEESSLFQRSGDDVLSEVNISYFEATLGATVLIQGIYGNEIPLLIPPGTQPDDLLCLKGEGFLSVCPTPAQQLHPSSSGASEDVASVPSSGGGGGGGGGSSSDIGMGAASSTEPTPFPRYTYRRRRRRSSYQPPPEGPNGEKPAYRTINRTDYFNSLLQKSNFFESTFLRQGGSPSSASPFTLFKDHSSSSSSSPGASSVDIGFGEEASTSTAAAAAATIHVPGSEEDLGDSEAEGTSGLQQPGAAHSGEAGRESNVGIEYHEHDHHDHHQPNNTNHDDDDDDGDGMEHVSPAEDRSPSHREDRDSRDHNQRRYLGRKRRSDPGREQRTNEGRGEEGTGMAKEAEEAEDGGAPLQASPPPTVNGYSVEVEMARRVPGGGTEVPEGEEGLDIRHTVMDTASRAPPPAFGEDPAHKAKEEEREEQLFTALDAIDIDADMAHPSDCEGVPMDHAPYMPASNGQSLMDLPRAPLLPKQAASAVPSSSPSSSPVLGPGQRRGNMYVRVKVTVPQAMSPQQTHLLTCLRQQWETRERTEAVYQ